MWSNLFVGIEATDTHSGKQITYKILLLNVGIVHDDVHLFRPILVTHADGFSTGTLTGIKLVDCHFAFIQHFFL